MADMSIYYKLININMAVYKIIPLYRNFKVLTIFGYKLMTFFTKTTSCLLVSHV